MAHPQSFSVTAKNNPRYTFHIGAAHPPTMTLWTLVIASVVYPLLAHVDVARGKNVGDIVTEIRIERTVYISPDWCANAEIGKAYPAQIDKSHTTVRLRVGQSTCKYHIVDTRPFLRRTPSPDLRP